MPQRPTSQLCMDFISLRSSARILFPTTSMSPFLFNNFLQQKIWSIWHRHNISRLKTTVRTTTETFLEPTFSGCCFILLCRKIPWKNDDGTFCLPFFTTHSLWNPHQWGGHLPTFPETFSLRSPMASRLLNQRTVLSSHLTQPMSSHWIDRVYHSLLLEMLSPLIYRTTCSSALSGPHLQTHLLDLPSFIPLLCEASGLWPQTSFFSTVTR